MRFGMRTLLAVSTYIAISAGLLVIVAEQSPGKLPGMLAVLLILATLAVSAALMRPRK